MTTSNMAWTTDSGTHELPRAVRGLPLADHPTVELLLPLRPPVPSRYHAPSAGLGYYVGAAISLLLPVAHLCGLLS